ncbi:hypothetical protein LIER_08303 [Lithospermum erythrorhizon]|uniref:Reverse transcriptase domain-containing protein n=1 Tax=Lithospermum erythrorhizon TaxID=34254 RepID=A0AAV3PCL9_LITER
MLWKHEWETIKKELKLPNGLFVDARGRKDGLALLCPSEEEIKKCVFSMNGSKAPGPDVNYLNNGRFLKKLNFTLITLVPKVERPISVGQFRPINLCNRVAKVIAKALSCRLKKLLPNVISDTQNAFMPDRLITKNILLAYEAHHALKHKKSCRQVFMSIKLDMLKVYDYIEWSFVRAMLTSVGFSLKWVQLIMDYVELVTYSLLINGLITLSKGACTRGELQSMSLGPGLEPMTHLMFPNDTLLLGSATCEEAAKLKDTRKAISYMLSMSEVASHGKYRGLPTTIGASKKEVFRSIVDRVKAKVDNWKPRLLSTLISSGDQIRQVKGKYIGCPGKHFLSQRMMVGLSFEIRRDLIKHYFVRKPGNSSQSPLVNSLRFTRLDISPKQTSGQPP